jgi:hypothetical protein
MRRVRSFLVLSAESSRWGNGSEFQMQWSDEEIASSPSQPVTGWHQCWKMAEGILDPQSGAEVLIVDGNKDHRVIACLSCRNLETPPESTAYPKWMSTKEHLQKVDGSDVPFFSNLNFSDYQWGWVAGAAREVPFRFNRLERLAAANPDGFIGRQLSRIAEFQAIFLAMVDMGRR